MTELYQAPTGPHPVLDHARAGPVTRRNVPDLRTLNDATTSGSCMRT
jgi:hypothetical protein